MKSDFLKGNTEGSDICMERRTGTPVEKWDDVNGLSEAHETGAVAVSDLSQGERFIQLRESTGMNRKDFAEYLGIPYRTMQDWERDTRTMPDYVFALIEYKVTAEFGLRLPQERDPNTIGNVRRGLEDQLEQNDNMLNGIIDNLPTDNSRESFKDDNANGIPDEEEYAAVKDEARAAVAIPGSGRSAARDMMEAVRESKEKESLIKQLHEFKPDDAERPHRSLAPELVL